MKEERGKKGPRSLSLARARAPYTRVPFLKKNRWPSGPFETRRTPPRGRVSTPPMPPGGRFTLPAGRNPKSRGLNGAPSRHVRAERQRGAASEADREREISVVVAFPVRPATSVSLFSTRKQLSADRNPRFRACCARVRLLPGCVYNGRALRGWRAEEAISRGGGERAGRSQDCALVSMAPKQPNSRLAHTVYIYIFSMRASITYLCHEFFSPFEIKSTTVRFRELRANFLSVNE